MYSLKLHGRIGEKNFKGVNKVHFEIVMSGSIKERLTGDYDEIVDLCKKAFIRELFAEKVFTDEPADVSATLYIVNADDDGEIYGYVEYQRKDEAEPFYSVYINGNGDRFAGNFDTRLIGGVRKASFGYRGVLFR